MMLDGKKNNPGSPQEIKDQRFLRHKFPKVVSFLHFGFQLAKEELPLAGVNRVR